MFIAITSASANMLNIHKQISKTLSTKMGGKEGDERMEKLQ